GQPGRRGGAGVRVDLVGLRLGPLSVRRPAQAAPGLDGDGDAVRWSDAVIGRGVLGRGHASSRVADLGDVDRGPAVSDRAGLVGGLHRLRVAPSERAALAGVDLRYRKSYG